MSGYNCVRTPRRRIAMVAACPFPAPRGSQVLIRDLAQTLADRGNEVHLVTYPNGESLSSLRGIHVHRVVRPSLHAGRSGLSWRKVVLDAGLGRTLYRVVREHRIDVIHAHNYEAPVVAYLVRALTGVPVVYDSHNVLADELAYYVRPRWQRAMARRFGAVLDAQVPRRADFCIALTPEIEAYLRAQGVPRERLRTVPPGATLRPERGPEPSSEPFTIVYTGNFDAYQDLDVLWEAMARLQGDGAAVALRIVTHDREWQRHRHARLAALMAAGVAHVVVASTYATVRRHMAGAHVLVCPRSSWSGFPIKLINYMAAGRAIVVGAGSAKGIVDGKTGLTFRNGDAAGLTAALRRLRDEPALRDRLGANAQVAARARYSWGRTAMQVEAIYGELCGVAEAVPAGAQPSSRLQVRLTFGAVGAGPRG